jgi:5S rRNA maturation endonuclease (ribonuclease M5)
MPITTFQDLVAQFPHTVELSTGELHSPCPFCRPESKVVYHRGRAFYGEDRLVWFADRKSVHCRRCRTTKKLPELAQEFDPSSTLEIDESAFEKPEKIARPIGLTEAYIDAMHSRVERDYWYAFGWDDATIDHFRLGYGYVAPGASGHGLRHLIPFQAMSLTWEVRSPVWVAEGRTVDPQQSRKAVRTTGVSGKIFWHIAEESIQPLMICEGMKDAVSLYHLGYRHIMSLAGTSTWGDELGEYIREQGYDQIVVVGDNDDAGRDISRIIGTFYKDSIIEVSHLLWPSTFQKKGDITDLLQEYGKEHTRDYMDQNLDMAPVIGFVKDYSLVDKNYIPPSPNKAKSVDQIREELPEVISDFLSITPTTRQRENAAL